MVIDVEGYNTNDLPRMNGSDQPKKTLKRKRPPTPSMSVEEREARIEGLNNEIEGLFRYFKESLSEKIEMGLGDFNNTSVNGVIACLIEESVLPFSKLVEEIYEKVKGRDGVSVTMASVKSSVLFVGQRSAYGVPNADADVLEDDTEQCLWCWEVIISLLFLLS